MRRVLPGIVLGLMCLGLMGQSKPAAPDARAALEDRWYSVLMENKPAGWLHTVIEQQGQRLISRNEMSLAIQRAGMPLTVAMTTRFVETQAGEPLEATVEQSFAMMKMAQTMRFGPEGIELTSQQAGRQQVQKLPRPAGDWMAPVAASRYVEQQLKQGAKEVTVRTLQPETGVQPVEIVATVTPGEQVRIGEVRFEGVEQTRESVLARRVRNGPGDLLNPLAVDQARFRLSRLGVFESVDVRYEPGDGPVRDPVFVLEEGRELEVNLLFGYGSYEQLRGGVELRQFNLLGRAHQTRLLAVQSLKSTRGEYSYTVPEIFGESVDGTARAFGLQRQEVSFLRQEWGGSVSLAADVHRIDANASVGYTYQALRNRDNNLATRGADDQQVTAASVDVGLTRDRRDNPLRPRRGYRVFAQAETASRYLGGGVDYQRIEFGGSYHVPWGRGRWVHAGLNHGLITTFGVSNDSDLPVNKRFFPGGDNSIRGYQAGEAAPRDAEGRFIGAKTYLLVNFEIEQALTTKWSVVAFADALGTAVRLGEYPFDEQLYSVGLGVRFQTLIGPLRAEYARNLNPRARDPGGTLLLSIGFPF